MLPTDLYGFNAHIEQQEQVLMWNIVSPDTPCDACYDMSTQLSQLNSDVVLRMNIHMGQDAKLGQDVIYYVDLLDAAKIPNDKLITVNAKSYSPVDPTKTTNIPLHAKIFSSLNQIKLLDDSDNEWFILSIPRNIITDVHITNDVSVLKTTVLIDEKEFSTTYTIDNYSTTVHNIGDGMNIHINPVQIEKGHTTSFALLGDVLTYSPHSDKYLESFELCPTNGGVVISHERCRTLMLKQYRGWISQQPLTFQRIPATVQFYVGDLKETQPCEIYVGSIHSIDEIEEIGGIGLKILGTRSSFKIANQETYEVKVKYGSYKVSVQYSAFDTTSTTSFDVSTKEYKMFANICSTCVKVSSNERLDVWMEVPPLKIYKSPEYLGNPGDHTSYESVPYVISNSSLLSGEISYLSFIFQRINDVVAPFIQYYNCPPPQFILEYFIPSSEEKQKVICDYVLSQINYSAEQFLEYFTTLELKDVKCVDKKIRNIITSFAIPSNRLSIQLYLGTVEQEKKVWISSIVEDVLMNELNIDTAVLNAKMSDEKVATVQLEFAQPLNHFMSIIPSVVPQRNILIQGIGLFEYENRTMNLIPENGGQVLELYGCGTIHDEQNRKVGIRYVKYSTEFAIDYSHPFVQKSLRGIFFIPMRKYICNVDMSRGMIGNGKLYNLQASLQTIVLPSDWMWIEDIQYVGTDLPLKINLLSLSTVGRRLLIKILSSCKLNPWNVLHLQTPDILNMVAADGSPIFRISYSGALMVPLIKTAETQLYNAVSSGEYMYDITDMHAL